LTIDKSHCILDVLLRDPLQEVFNRGEAADDEGGELQELGLIVGESI
jgi:hypothetical protein